MLIKFGEFELDERSRRIRRGDEPVGLTGQALDLLCLLVKRPGELISREEIQRHLWPESNTDLQHSLDVLLNRLRATLGDSGKSPRFIETVPRRVGRGFIDTYPSRAELNMSGKATYRELASTRTESLVISDLSPAIKHRGSRFYV